MADLNKFEEMLEKLVNEDRAGAEELFHEIVVAKSREIYQDIIESEEEVDEDFGQRRYRRRGRRRGKAPTPIEEEAIVFGSEKQQPQQRF